MAVKRTAPTLLDYRNRATIKTYEDVAKKCQEVRTLLRLRMQQRRGNSDSGGGTGAQQHILQLHEFFWRYAGHPDNCELNLVTELLGMNLRQWLSQQESFTEQQARDVAKSVLTGLSFMHENRVVHRDVKEENVMFRVPDDLTSLKICDFGFAQELVGSDGGDEATTTGFCGTLGYLAPEIYAGDSYGTPVDLFSFGVLLFLLLSGEKPWPGSPSHATREATMQLQYCITDRRRWLLVSEQGKDLVRRLLTYSSDRITAAQALRHPWFGERSNSVLHAGNASSVYFPGARARNASRAIIEVVSGLMIFVFIAYYCLFDQGRP